MPNEAAIDSMLQRVELLKSENNLLRRQSVSAIYLVRHGDRLDYANKDLWHANAAELGHNERDLPLSELGHRQAQETAAALSAAAVDQILVRAYTCRPDLAWSMFSCSMQLLSPVFRSRRAFELSRRLCPHHCTTTFQFD